MSEEREDIDGVEFEFDLNPEATIDLDAEWVGWLEAEPVPANVDGIDPSMTIGGDEGAAIA